MCIVRREGQHSSYLRWRRPAASLFLALAISAGLIADGGITPAHARRSSAPQSVAPEPRSLGPLLVLVSIRKQRLRVFDNNGEITSTRISSGQPGFDTPTGVFSILEKHVTHQSNIYEGAEMPFMQRITWSGIALHSGIVPGYRASHGCVRLPWGFAKSFFGITHVGNRVVISQDETEPVAFAHPFLFKPLPADAPQSQGSLKKIEDTKVASNEPDPKNTADIQGLMTVAEISDPQGEAGQAGRPRTRAEFQREMDNKVLDLKNALKAAEDEKKALLDKIKNSGRMIDEASQRVKSAKSVVGNFWRVADSIAKSRTEAIKAYDDYMKSLISSSGAGPTIANSDQEAMLEERILDLTIEADMASEEATRREGEVGDVGTLVADVEKEKVIAGDDIKMADARIRSIEAAIVATQKELQQKARIVSIFVSLKAQRIYIRQGFDPVVEAPITIKGSPGQVGTHVLTAMDYAPGGNDLIWKLVSAQTPGNFGTGEEAPRKGRKRDAEVVPQASPGAKAAQVALDAISIPEEVRQTITDRIRPGSSIIISDRELSPETGDGTEFVLLTR